MLQMEVAQLKNTFEELNVEVHKTETVLERLGDINSSLKEIGKLKERQATIELNMQELRACQIVLRRNFDELCGNVTKNDNEDVYVFSAPDTFLWFTGRTRQIKEIEAILKNGDQSSPRKAAICGLGGSGKTSLVVEYAHRMKNYYQGGVFWFSGEDGTKMENSVNHLALSFKLAISNRFDVTLSHTRDRISRIQKPWLLIIDDMDEFRVSPNVRTLLSDSWQRNCNYGHIIVTTRRNPSTLVNEVQAFKESSCLELQCFNADESKEFLFHRTGISQNEDTKAAAHKLFEELDGLPLALEQAAAYIKSLKRLTPSGVSFSSYLESYKAKRLALLNQQPSNPVSLYSSPERLAVRTTWDLNIDYIKKNSEGRNALRFLNACAFFNPDQIQEVLINVGDPPVKDHQFRNFLGTSLGRFQILKLLTDFSLFKQSSYGCLQVHRLVLDVIKESLTPSEQEESFVDAVRFLQHSLSTFCSPDVLLSSEMNLVDHTNPSLFYMWRALCMHAEEIEKNLKSILCSNTEWTAFFPETARIVYQHALYLSVFYKHEEAVQAMNFALKILDWIPYAERELPYTDYISFFHHVVPLPESFRRHVQYCSKAPATALPSDNAEQCVDSFSEAEALEKLREEGNRLFCDGRYQDAVDVYSTAIKRKDESKFFDPRFFSNRASAYLRLERYKDALEDAEAYISQSPKCWKGYARKALALHGAGDKLGAKLAACQTFILNPDVLTEYKRFKKFSHLKQCITRSSNLVDAVGKKVICLRPDTYDISQYVRLQDCIVIGFDEKSSDMAKVKVNFVGQSSAGVVGRCAFANLEFVFEQGRCCCWENSLACFQNCSFTSHSKESPSLATVGDTTVENCEFKNCNAAGLRCARGTLRVKNCTFYGNKKAALQVRESGTLSGRNVNIHHNYQGVEIGPEAKKCTLTNSQVNNSEREGIYCVHSHCDESVNIYFENNAIFHNDTFGVFVFDSAADIIGNNVYENSWWGVWIQSNSYCRFSKNKVNRNGVGGVRIGFRAPDCQPCVVDSNTVNNNGGPSIFEYYNPVDKPFLFRQLNPFPFLLTDEPLPQNLEDKLVHAQCEENTTLGNKELDKKPSCIYPTQSEQGFCSNCRKETTLQKCENCYTAGYCRSSCQEEHWEHFHKDVCLTLLERNSVVLRDPVSAPDVRHRSRPQQVGTQSREQFIVKVQIDEPELGIQISDKNLDVDEFFNSDRIRNLVIDLGVPNLEAMKIKKKLFMWAAFTENEMIRLFTNDFPLFQQW